jgi:hypothetical protein
VLGSGRPEDPSLITQVTKKSPRLGGKYCSHPQHAHTLATLLTQVLVVVTGSDQKRLETTDTQNFIHPSNLSIMGENGGTAAPASSDAATVAEREAELLALQNAFDEYIASSRELEEELDTELAKMRT